MDIRQEEAVMGLEGEKRRMQNMHRMHLKLLSTRLFESTINKSIKRAKESHFEHLQRVVRINKH
jgi:hypothetical protein